MGLNENFILKQINVITGTQDDHLALTSRTGDTKKSSNVTPDKGHRKNLVASSPFQKYTTNRRKITETYGSKPHYKG